MFTCLRFRRISDKNVQVEKTSVTKAVYRDELSKKQSPRKAVKKTVRFADSAPTILGEKNEKEDCEKRIFSAEERPGIRVKVKMTKEEAIQFLSKIKEGGFLDVKDVAPELVSFSVNRVKPVPNCLNNDPPELK